MTDEEQRDEGAQELVETAELDDEELEEAAGGVNPTKNPNSPFPD